MLTHLSAFKAEKRLEMEPLNSRSSLNISRLTFLQLHSKDYLITPYITFMIQIQSLEAFFFGRASQSS